MVGAENDNDSQKSSSSSGISIQNDDQNNVDMFKLKPAEQEGNNEKDK